MAESKEPNATARLVAVAADIDCADTSLPESESGAASTRCPVGLSLSLSAHLARKLSVRGVGVHELGQLRGLLQSSGARATLLVELLARHVSDKASADSNANRTQSVARLLNNACETRRPVADSSFWATAAAELQHALGSSTLSAEETKRFASTAAPLLPRVISRVLQLVSFALSERCQRVLHAASSSPRGLAGFAFCADDFLALDRSKAERRSVFTSYCLIRLMTVRLHSAVDYIAAADELAGSLTDASAPRLWLVVADLFEQAAAHAGERQAEAADRAAIARSRAQEILGGWRCHSHAASFNQYPL